MRRQHTSLSISCVKTPETLPGLFFLCTAVLFLAVSCATSPAYKTDLFPTEELVPSDISWEPVCSGIQRTDFNNPHIPLIWHALRIDLSSETIELISNPSEKLTGSSVSVSSFSKKYRAAAAVNANPFSITGLYPFSRRYPVGIYIENGNELSPPSSRYGALVFFASGNGTGYRSVIIDSQSEIAQMNEKPLFAFGGFWTILRNGHIPVYVLHRAARTAAGTDSNGTILYLLAVEGLQRHTSTGLSFMECGSIMEKMGAHTAVMLDGGPSTQMYINGKNVLSYSRFRKSADCFGFAVRARTPGSLSH